MMKIEIRVKPAAKKTEVEKQADGTYLVKVKEPADKGKANQAVIEVIAEYFAVPKQNVTIICGQTSRHKIVNLSFI